MKKTTLAIGLIFFAQILVAAFPIITNTRMYTNGLHLKTIKFNCFEVKNNILTFKISGMKSEQDAVVIDKFLLERDFITSSSTDFKTGLCKVETDKVENKAKIIEAICYAGKKNGYKISAELVDSMEVKD